MANEVGTEKGGQSALGRPAHTLPHWTRCSTSHTSSEQQDVCGFTTDLNLVPGAQVEAPGTPSMTKAQTSAQEVAHGTLSIL